MEMGFRWDFAYEILPQMLLATLNTIIAAGVGYIIALVVGLFFLLGQRTPYKIINFINREIVEKFNALHASHCVFGTPSSAPL